jgi:hypothetical protein
MERVKTIGGFFCIGPEVAGCHDKKWLFNNFARQRVRKLGLDHRSGHARVFFERPAGTRCRSNSLPLFQKHPGAASLPWEIGRNDDQGRNLIPSPVAG